MPHAQRDGRGVDVRIAPVEVTRILREDVQLPVRTQNQELLAPGAAPTVKEECDLVAVGTVVER